MTKATRTIIVQVFQLTAEALDAQATRATGEDHQAFHGAARSVEKLARRAAAKKTTEEKEGQER